MFKALPLGLDNFPRNLVSVNVLYNQYQRNVTKKLSSHSENCELFDNLVFETISDEILSQHCCTIEVIQELVTPSDLEYPI